MWKYDSVCQNWVLKLRMSNKAVASSEINFRNLAVQTLGRLWLFVGGKVCIRAFSEL